jgi:D-amino-acid dehydrogenase
LEKSMKVAVVGAGIAGACTAYELALDGHDVTVYDRNASVAEGASFANGGQLSSSLTQPMSHPLWPSGILGALRGVFFSSKWSSGISSADIRWILRWSSQKPPAFTTALRASHGLLTNSAERLQAISQSAGLMFEQTNGKLLLIGSESEAHSITPKLDVLKEFGVKYNVLTPPQAQLLEPGLAVTGGLHSAIQFPADAIGNCRLFAQLIKDKTQQAGVKFRLGKPVRSVSPGTRPAVQLEGSEPETYDAVVLCAGNDPDDLLGKTGTRTFSASIRSYSISLAIREPLNAPRSAVLVSKSGITITRNGARIRVCGGSELGKGNGKNSPRTIHQLYDALQQYFPGSASHQQSPQVWSGRSLITPDALPLIGPSAAPGIYLNMGHGNNGWGMACGAARMITDLVGQKPTAVDPTPFFPLRQRS